MTDEAHLDGNALGGLLQELFERDMTNQLGRCGNCGSVRHLGEVQVFNQAPGDVMRCPVCHVVLMVVVRLPSGFRVSFESLSWLEMPADQNAE